MAVSQTLGTSARPSPPPTSGAGGWADLPAAARAGRPGWRDPRLWVGVAIVAASVVLGAKVVGAADDSVAVWAVSTDMGPGDEVAAGDLVVRHVRFVQASDADAYLSAAEPLPEDARLTRDVGAGELLPRAALGTQAALGQQTMTFLFEGPGVPSGLAQGDRVDVYVTSTGQSDDQVSRQGRTTAARPGGTLVLRDLVVTALGGAETGLGGSSAQSVTVGVPSDAAPADLGAAVQAAKTDNVFLVKQG